MNKLLNNVFSTFGVFSTKVALALFGKMVLITVWSSTAMAIPAGTLISNSAQVSFSVSGIPGFLITSNTDTITVVASPATDTAVLTIAAPATQRIYGGESALLNVALNNVGVNDLTAAQLRVVMQSSITVDLNGTMPVTTTITGNMQAVTFPVADVLAASTANYVLNLALPTTVDVTNNLVSVELIANAQSITSQNIILDINSRTVADVKLMQRSNNASAPLEVVSTTEYDIGDGTFSILTAPSMKAKSSAPTMSVTAAPVPLEVATVFSHMQNMFIRVADMDQNIDGSLQETILVRFTVDNGDTETLRLTETGADTGLFIGYATLASSGAALNNGVLNVPANSKVTFAYNDGVSVAESKQISIIVDPYGKVFDTQTGDLLDGYTVRLVNMDTGSDATVYGDDGTTLYPSTVVTGSLVTDAGGTLYQMDPGSFRFPLAPVGNYQLEVTAPSGALYTWPSTMPDEQLGKVPNGPFIITLGSKAEVFPLSAGPPLNVDIPVDPLSTQLNVTRSANKNIVSAGDFIQFKVTVENATSGVLVDVLAKDVLPRGFRYEKGSLVINGNPVSDANLLISESGNQLTLPLGTFDPFGVNEASFEYVAAVGAHNRGKVMSSSEAVANTGSAKSNKALFELTIEEELFRSHAILMGRVIVDPSPENKEQPSSGLQNVRIYLEDGRYVVTDKHGMFRFDNVLPGAHVVQLDLDSLPEEYQASAFMENTRFAGRSWSQFVDLQGGTIWRTDFHVTLKPREKGEVALQISNEPQLEEGTIEYVVEMENSAVELKRVLLTVRIPDGTKYKSGSASIAGIQIDDPSVLDNILSFRMGKLTAQQKQNLQFAVVIDEGNAEIKELIIKAVLSFNTPVVAGQRTPFVEHVLVPKFKQVSKKVLDDLIIDSYDEGTPYLNERGLELLDGFVEKLSKNSELQLFVIGYSDDVPVVKEQTVNRYGNNYNLSHQRAQVISSYLREKLKLTPDQVTILAKGSDEPVANNNNYEGRSKNRRAYIAAASKETELVVESATLVSHSKKTSASTTGNHPSSGSNKVSEKSLYNLIYGINKNDDEQSTNEWKKLIQSAIPSEYANVSVGENDGLASRAEWVYPEAEELMDIPSTRIIINQIQTYKVKLLLNGKAVSARNYDGKMKNNKGATLAVWSGVDLAPGENNFTAVVIDADGIEVEQLQRTVLYAGLPVKAEFIESASLLVSDGLTKPVIAIHFTDQEEYPIREGSVGIFDIKSNHQLFDNTKFENRNVPGVAELRQEYRVGKGGIALITLLPTDISGDVKLEIPLANGRVEEIRVPLKAKKRDWIIVGLAEGTAGYNTIKDNLTSTNSANQTYQDSRVSLFAKGQISGDWLLTMAYDSAKEGNRQQDPKLYQAIDPNKFYTIYGDKSHQAYGAPTSEKLYLKLESDQFFALFGDFQTGFTDTELTKYNRTLTGVQSRYHNQKIDVIVFASESKQAFVRDEIRAQGMSGPYSLSRHNIAMNSEMISIEVRDRFSSEVVVENRLLTRHVDYDINYEQGVIIFRQAMFSTDSSFNPQYIIVEYEAFDEGDITLTSGGRAEFSISQNSKLAVTHVTEGRTGGHAEMSGVDLRVKLGADTEIRAEVAQSQDKQPTAAKEGSAYKIEMNHRSKVLKAKVYVREEEAGYGLGQLMGTEKGIRKYGAESSVMVTRQMTLQAKASQEEQLETVTSRQLFETEGRYNFDSANLRLGARSVTDQRINNVEQRSEQMTLGASKSFFKGRLSLRADREQNINTGTTNSVDYPTRTRLGTDYLLTDKSKLFIEQEISDGELRDTRHTLMGIKSTPWQGGNLFAGVKVKQDNNGESNTSANIAARQKWQINKVWSLDFGIEEVRTLEKGSDTLFEAPYASGSNTDFTAASVGATYSPGDWLWSSRLENRDGDLEDSMMFATSVQSSPDVDLSTLASLEVFNSQQVTGSKQDRVNIALGLAYRPKNDRWLMLDRLQLQWGDRTSVDLNSEEWRVINNFNANYQPRKNWQLAFQFAAKSVKETINGLEYESVADLIGIETRYDLTRRWDVGVHSNVLHVWNVNQYDYSSGLSMGHVVAKNIWISLGYNLTGFQDEDFSKSRYTSEGAFLKFRMKFDQATFKDAKEWLR